MLAAQTIESMSYLNTARMENVFPMKPETRPRTKGSKPGIRRQLPDNFICIAPEEARHVLDWLNGSALEHEKEIAVLHFNLCLHCQEAVAELKLIKEALTENAKESLHLSTNQILAHLNACSCTLHDKAEHEAQRMLSEASTPFMKAAGEG